MYKCTGPLTETVRVCARPRKERWLCLGSIDDLHVMRICTDVASCDPDTKREILKWRSRYANVTSGIVTQLAP